MASRLIVRHIEFAQRPVGFRTPFRFGAAKFVSPRDGKISAGSLRQTDFASNVDPATVGIPT